MRIYDEDADAVIPELLDEDGTKTARPKRCCPGPCGTKTTTGYREAGKVYAEYVGRCRRRFKWLRPTLFVEDLGRSPRRRPGPTEGARSVRLVVRFERCQAVRPGQVADHGSSAREGGHLYPIRRHCPLPHVATPAARSLRAGGRYRRLG